MLAYGWMDGWVGGEWAEGYVVGVLMFARRCWPWGFPLALVCLWVALSSSGAVDEVHCRGPP